MAQDLSGPNVRLLLEAVQGFLNRATEEPQPAAAPSPPSPAAPPPSVPTASAAPASEEDMLEAAAQAARDAYQESMQKYEEANRLCQQAMAAKVAREQEEQKARERAEEERREAAEREATEDRVRKLEAKLATMSKEKAKDKPKLQPCALPLHKAGVYPLLGNDAQLELFARVRPLAPVDEAWEKKNTPRFASAPVEVESEEDARKPKEPDGPPPAPLGLYSTCLELFMNRGNGGLVLWMLCISKEQTQACPTPGS
jgi:chemotaxis protein histidine kinase CheA